MEDPAEPMLFSSCSLCKWRLRILVVIKLGRSFNRAKSTDFRVARKAVTVASRTLQCNRSLRASASEGAQFRLEEAVVLGVESSCDDTGVAVLRGSGEVLGEALQSQTDVHMT